MEEVKQRAAVLLEESMSDIEITKSKFSKIITTINETSDNQFTHEMKTHLNTLNRLWDNNEDANIEYYFEMKEHHSYINGKIENDILNEKWMDYIKSCALLRLKLVRLNHLCSELPRNAAS